jgi:hypothetical protein
MIILSDLLAIIENSKDPDIIIFDNTGLFLIRHNLKGYEELKPELLVSQVEKIDYVEQNAYKIIVKPIE